MFDLDAGHEASWVDQAWCIIHCNRGLKIPYPKEMEDDLR